MQEIEPQTFRNVVRMRAVFHIVSRERERVCSGGGVGFLHEYKTHRNTNKLTSLLGL